MSDDIYRAEVWYSDKWDEIVIMYGKRWNVFFVGSVYGDEQWSSTKGFVRIGIL